MIVPLPPRPPLPALPRGVTPAFLDGLARLDEQRADEEFERWCARETGAWLLMLAAISGPRPPRRPTPTHPAPPR